MSIPEDEMEDFMAKLDRSVFDKGRWDYTGEAALLIIDYDMDMTDIVEEFREASTAQEMVKTLDIYDLAEFLHTGFDDLPLIVGFIVSTWLGDNRNVIIGVDKSCDTDDVCWVELLRTLGAQFSVTGNVIEVLASEEDH